MSEFNVPDSELAAFFQRVGTTVVTWGLIEQCLDMCIAELYHNGGNSISKRIPQGLKQKIAFTRKCLQRLPQFEPFRILLSEFVDELEDLSQKRHDYIHSAISSYSHETSNITSYRIVNQGHRMVSEKVEFNPDHYPHLLRRLMGLFERGNNVTNIVQLFSESIQLRLLEELNYPAKPITVLLTGILKPPYYMSYWPHWPPWH